MWCAARPRRPPCLVEARRFDRKCRSDGTATTGVLPNCSPRRDRSTVCFDMYSRRRRRRRRRRRELMLSKNNADVREKRGARTRMGRIRGNENKNGWKSKKKRVRAIVAVGLVAVFAIRDLSIRRDRLLLHLRLRRSLSHRLLGPGRLLLLPLKETATSANAQIANRLERRAHLHTIKHRRVEST